MTTTRFLIHHDLKSFDFDMAHVDKAVGLVFSELSFVPTAHNIVFISAPRAGNTPRLSNRNRGFATPQQARALHLDGRTVPRKSRNPSANKARTFTS
jgi:hypothetical protein